MIKKLLLILAAILVVSCKQVSTDEVGKTDEAGKWGENEKGYDIYMEKSDVRIVKNMDKGQSIKIPYYRNPAINFVGLPTRADLSQGGGIDLLNSILVTKIDEKYITIQLSDEAENMTLDGLGTGVGYMVILNKNAEGKTYFSNNLAIILNE